MLGNSGEVECDKLFETCEAEGRETATRAKRDRDRQRYANGRGEGMGGSRIQFEIRIPIPNTNLQSDNDLLLSPCWRRETPEAQDAKSRRGSRRGTGREPRACVTGLLAEPNARSK